MDFEVEVEVGTLGLEVEAAVGTVDTVEVRNDVELFPARDEDEGCAELEELEELPSVRYQFVRFVSPRQSPTVTPFQPLALIRS